MRYPKTWMPVVLVIAKDWKLRAAVQAELRERGSDALEIDSPGNAAGFRAHDIKPASYEPP
jgi:hypothetical protein